VVPQDVALFGQEVSAHLRTILDNDLLGTYFVGSIALGGYVAGESDIDILAVAAGPVPRELKNRIADEVLRSAMSGPARGLEFSLYRREVVSRPPRGADFEVSVNGGPGIDRKVVFDRVAEPGFWYVLDRAVAHRSGITIVGPGASEVIVDVARPTLLEMMAESMRWHREHEKATLYSVLNAARAWRFAAENVLGSKLEGASWARERWLDPETIDAAVQLRRGSAAQLDPGKVDDFLAHVETTLTSSV
jgi:hypothetical protein